LISVTGPKSLDARFPGQWFQFEAGLHANWHRTYDPTLGRYLEADPLGFPDGPNRYAYVGSSPLMYVDPEGTWIVPLVIGLGVGIGGGLAVDFGLNKLKQFICSCGKNGSTAASEAFPSAPVAAATGAAVGLTHDFAKKGRVGIAGGGKSKMKTSFASLAVHWAYKAGILSVGMKLGLRHGLRVVPGLGAGLVAGYGVYDAFQCK
jgi:RHS repeat-associated protein